MTTDPHSREDTPHDDGDHNPSHDCAPLDWPHEHSRGGKAVREPDLEGAIFAIRDCQWEAPGYQSTKHRIFAEMLARYGITPEVLRAPPFAEEPEEGGQS